MLLLKKGDRLPTVAGVQLNLNLFLPDPEKLDVDGDFGRLTEAAVKQFQRMFPGVLRVDGEIGRLTWQKLAELERLKVRDWADVSDPLLYEAVQIANEQVGSTPIESGFASFAVSGVASSVEASGVGGNQLFLLRFLGHGNRGSQVIGYGTGCHVLYTVVRQEGFRGFEACVREMREGTITDHENAVVREAMAFSGLNASSFSNPIIAASLTPLKDLLSPYGSIEFHGCQVGGGARGQRFLQAAADFFGVPCSGAERKQTTGDAVRFSGPVATACPGAVSLKQWARGLAPIPYSGDVGMLLRSSAAQSQVAGSA